MNRNIIINREVTIMISRLLQSNIRLHNPNRLNDGGILIGLGIVAGLIIGAIVSNNDSKKQKEAEKQPVTITKDNFLIRYKGKETPPPIVEQFADLSAPYTFGRNYGVQTTVSWEREFEVGGGVSAGAPGALQGQLNLDIGHKFGVDFTHGSQEYHEVLLDPKECPDWSVLVFQTFATGEVTPRDLTTGFRDTNVKILQKVRLEALNHCTGQTQLGLVKYIPQ